MKQAIRTKALELGFDGCRFTNAAPASHAPEYLQWISHGYHAQMEYMARNPGRRTDPCQLFPGARSVIVLAASYHHDYGELPAKTARYSHFRDYHDVLAEHLKQLVEFINQQAGAKCVWYVDTGALLERDLAQRAGLGFAGKHTNLISRSLGNWFFLSEILTTLEIEPDKAETNHCGGCSRCLNACPTHALPAPFQLDARRCISFLTIENKGPIPVELRSAIGNHVFGCDECLAVCPWNRFAKEGRLMRSHFLPNLAHLDLLELLAIDESGFKKRFAGTPMLRSKRRGLLRNVCVVLGNLGEKSALEKLGKAALDPEPLIAEHARWAIEQIKKRRTFA